MEISITPRFGTRMSSRVLPAPFLAESLKATVSWGARPGEAHVTYVKAPEAPPVPVMAEVLIQWGGHRWHGVCLDDQQDHSDSTGLTRTLRVADTRIYLEWDTVFAAFNIAAHQIVDGRLVRRFAHVLPKDFVENTRTFTLRPYTAAEVANFVFGFTRRSRSASYTVERTWRLVMDRIMRAEPVMDLDWTRGANLQQVAQELADRLGLVVGVLPDAPNVLRWVRKGVGVFPAYEGGSPFPASSTMRRWGVSYSGAPSRVRVVGGRNLYQVMDIDMEPDWLSAWERFLDLALLEDDLFHRATTAAGVPLRAIAGDSDGSEGRFHAAALAREITVAQYATLRRRQPRAGDIPTEEWLDRKLWQGRRRADMPAALYISKLLFRAFRPKGLKFPITGAKRVPIQSLEVVQRLLAPVAHDPISGRMQVDMDSPTDGNGYAIAQGYQLGADGLITVQPEFFKLETWRQLQDLWQAIPFSADQSGEGVPVILFADPVIRTDNLVTMVDGIPVVRANASIQVPRVRACLVFAAEVFQHVEGVGPRDKVEVVPNLHGEFVTSAVGGARAREIPYADRETARVKARRIARAQLSQPDFTIRGGFRVPGANGHRINALYDRVSIEVDGGGFTETIDFTNERIPVTYESERRFDRLTREQLLLPGQAELKSEARSLRQLAAALRTGDGVRNSIQSWLRGSNEPPITVAGSPDAAVLPVGTPLWSEPSSAASPAQAVYAPDSRHVIFAGVTTRDGDPASGLVSVRRTGEVFARVRGPVAANQVVGRASGDSMGTHLIAGGDIPVGIALAEVGDGEERLIRVRVSGGGGTYIKAMQKWLVVGSNSIQLLESFGAGFAFAQIQTDASPRFEVTIDAEGPLALAVPRAFVRAQRVEPRQVPKVVFFPGNDAQASGDVPARKSWILEVFDDDVVQSRIVDASVSLAFANIRQELLLKVGVSIDGPLLTNDPNPISVQPYVILIEFI